MPVWDCFSVKDVFLERAGWDPTLHFDQDRFDMDLVEKIEPGLSRERPTILKDYPVEAAALARIKNRPYPCAERWELYIAGMEIANAFSELTDPVEQRIRFEKCAKSRADAGRPVYDIDGQFLSALESGMSESAGIALGIDRLVMLFANCEKIGEVRCFVED
jgi:lysyl-tRNA synthetase class 2